MLKTLAFAAVLSALSAWNAFGCQVDFVDENGDLTDPPTLDENIAASSRAFVGTVKGYRTYAGTVLEQNIDCWFDDSVSDEDCEALQGSIMSVVMTVDHTIKGIAEGRLYEETYETGDGGCGPYFEFGKRYIYNQGLFGVEELPGDATEAQLTHWRSLDAPEPKPYKYPFPEYPYQCLSIDSEVASELAEAATAVVATVLSFRIDDAQLTDDLSACNQPDSAACKQLTDAVISVRIDIEDSIKGPNELGPREVSYWSRGNCQLPQPGQRFLLGGSYGDYWADLNEPRVLLSEPPSDEQIADWRTAALVGDSDTD